MALKVAGEDVYGDVDWEGKAYAKSNRYHNENGEEINSY